VMRLLLPLLLFLDVTTGWANETFFFGVEVACLGRLATEAHSFSSEELRELRGEKLFWESL